MKLAASGFAFVFALTLSTPAVSQTVTVDRPSANLSGATGPGAATATYSDLDGLPGNERVLFSTPFGGNLRNSLAFSSSPQQNVAIGSRFDLGTLTFGNFPTFPGSEIEGFALTLNTPITYLGTAYNPSPFSFLLGLENTPNDPGNCPYPSTQPCSDALTISGSPTPATFQIGGSTLSLFIDGFKDANGVFGTKYIAQEDGTSSATLVGRFDLVTPAVPEPATWSMMIAGFGAIGATMRRRKRATFEHA